jgi:formamidopyrimidine-DNA glycosylase
MPELPEVQTTVSGLQKVLPRLAIRDVWSDLPTKKVSLPYFEETLKSASFFSTFKREVAGARA